MEGLDSLQAGMPLCWGGHAGGKGLETHSLARSTLGEVGGSHWCASALLRHV